MSFTICYLPALGFLKLLPKVSADFTAHMVTPTHPQVPGGFTDSPFMDTFFYKLSLPSRLASRSPLILTWSFLTFLLVPCRGTGPSAGPSPSLCASWGCPPLPELCGFVALNQMFSLDSVLGFLQNVLNSPISHCLPSKPTDTLSIASLIQLRPHSPPRYQQMLALCRLSLTRRSPCRPWILSPHGHTAPVQPGIGTRVSSLSCMMSSLTCHLPHFLQPDLCLRL